MAMLEYEENGQVRSMQLDKATIRIGRSERCDICLAKSRNMSASRIHAEIRRDGSVVHLVDLNSTCGTLMGTGRVKKARLANGDRFRIGGTTFVFHDSDDSDTSQPSDGPVGDLLVTRSNALAADRRSCSSSPTIDSNDLIPFAPTPGERSGRPYEIETHGRPAYARPVRQVRTRELGLMWWMVWLQWALKTVICLVLVAAIPAYVWWQRSSAEEGARAAREAEEKAEAQLASSATSDINGLIAKGLFQDARNAVSLWQAKGLRDGVVYDLMEQTNRKARAKATEHLAGADAAVRAGDADKAEELLARAKDLASFGFDGGNRFAELPVEIEQIRRQQRLEKGQAGIKTAFALLSESQYDDALRTKIKAMKCISGEADRAFFEKKFKEMMGARLKIGPLPDGAIVLLLGHDRHPHRSGEVIAGLPDGEVRGIVKCRDYMDQAFVIGVKYPDESVYSLSAPMVHEAPPAAWALEAVRSALQPCGALVRYYYSKSLSSEDEAALRGRLLAHFSDGMIGGAKPDADDAALQGKIQHVLDAKNMNHVLLLNELAELAARSNRGTAHGFNLILEDPRARKRVKRAIRMIENGCSKCMGLGGPLCTACGGDGRGPRKTKCEYCDGTNKVTCPLCDGTSLRTCPVCKGSGRKNGRRCTGGCSRQHIVVYAERDKRKAKVRGTEKKTRKIDSDGDTKRKSVDVDGESDRERRRVISSKWLYAIPCNCQHGQRPCTKCSAGWVFRKNRFCTKCQGTGVAGTCKSCHGERTRASMNREDRIHAEKVIARYLYEK